jgi:hypothetical protein
MGDDVKVGVSGGRVAGWSVGRAAGASVGRLVGWSVGACVAGARVAAVVEEGGGSGLGVTVGAAQAMRERMSRKIPRND